jgi:hypothetical protein
MWDGRFDGVGPGCGEDGAVGERSRVLSAEQQAGYLELMLKGASPVVACRRVGAEVTAAAETLDCDPEFRRKMEAVRRLMSECVMAAVYRAAIEGKVSAQRLWLKENPLAPAASDCAASGGLTPHPRPLSAADRGEGGVGAEEEEEPSDEELAARLMEFGREIPETFSPAVVERAQAIYRERAAGSVVADSVLEEPSSAAGRREEVLSGRSESAGLAPHPRPLSPAYRGEGRVGAAIMRAGVPGRPP